MTVAEFIEWLKTQDQEAIVEVIVNESSRDYEGGVTECTKDFTPELSDYDDLRCNPFITPDNCYFNKRRLLLGEFS